MHSPEPFEQDLFKADLQFAYPLSMNRPTPDPSQEESRHPSASCPFPSWEGLGVGSWSQCIRQSEWRLSMNRVRKREQAPRTPNAAAQWPRAWDSAKRLECVRLAGAFHGSWSQCMHKSERRLSMNRNVVQASRLPPWAAPTE